MAGFQPPRNYEKSPRKLRNHDCAHPVDVAPKAFPEIHNGFLFSFSKGGGTNHTHCTNSGRERFVYYSSSRLTAVGKIRVIGMIRGGFPL